MSRQLGYLIDKRHEVRRNQGLIEEAHHRMPDGKLIVTMHTCMRCGETFTPRKGRTRCMNCQGPLRSKTTILHIS
jgi:hypothetical protein